ncbi:hypothetical protein Metho_2710 (plasmid) [Methanomethylovorans hollandica DSM 15978]|jgi:hypothetical protein|uniref:Uncharacterized protein n=1 Tax=Methanomethylovorans hollandica (strain DSM 15978 / NBRC 107637 / DMS1) TaxID=867904 RepID=L0L3F3_METHD|nr:hypothetical protein Metho_2710 [Methanomethylovorans hollandica DSM 15978]
MPLLVLVIISGVMSVSLDILTSFILGDIMTTITTTTAVINATKFASTLLRARDAVLTSNVNDMYENYQF